MKYYKHDALQVCKAIDWAAGTNSHLYYYADENKASYHELSLVRYDIMDIEKECHRIEAAQFARHLQAALAIIEEVGTGDNMMSYGKQPPAKGCFRWIAYNKSLDRWLYLYKIKEGGKTYISIDIEDHFYDGQSLGEEAPQSEYLKAFSFFTTRIKENILSLQTNKL